MVNKLNDNKISLKNLQLGFLEAMQHDTDIILPWIESNQITILKRLSIYQQNIRLNLLHVLEEIYPIVKLCVGEEFFQSLCQVYIQHYPSKSGNLEIYGKEFSDFIKEFEHTQSLPYLTDVAQYEWLTHLSHNAPDAPLVIHEILASFADTPIDHIYVTYHPSVKFFSSPMGIHKIIAMATKETSEQSDQSSVNIMDQACYAIITRPHTQVNIHWLPYEEFQLLVLLSKAQSLGTSLELLLAETHSIELTKFLPKLLEMQVMSELSLAPIIGE